METIGLWLLVTGFIIYLIGSIQFLIAEFSVSFWWLIGGIFFPIIDIVFLCVHFHEAWPLTKKCLIGALLLLAGVFFRSGIA